MDHEKFKNIAAGIQSLAIAAAALITGAWAIFTFDALGSVNRAAAELAELEQRIRQEPVLQIDLSVQAVPASQGGRLLLITALLKNDGKRGLEVEFPESPVLASKIKVDGDQMQVLGSPLRVKHAKLTEEGKLEPITQRILRSGQSRSIHFVVHVFDPGDFLIQFSAVYNGVELSTGLVEQTDDAPIVATAQAFFHLDATRDK